MNKYRKEFTFDLKVETLKQEFGEKGYTKGYDQLNDFFCNKMKYEHRQGSVYYLLKRCPLTKFLI